LTGNVQIARCSPMSNLRDFLARREGELEQRIKEIEAELRPLRMELLEVKRAQHAILGPFDRPPTNPPGSPIEDNPFDRLTLKEMVRKALQEHFQNGATALELLAFFKSKWGRDVPRPSLSPQLSRLKEEGILDLKGRVWLLQSDAIPSLVDRMERDDASI